MDQLAAEYVKILQDVKGKAITNGEVSQALSAYGDTYCSDCGKKLSDGNSIA